jgi:hypothetical protein
MKKIWEGKGEEVHDYFIRFSKGRFEGRAALNLQKVSKVKLKGSFEWVNDFVELVSELADIQFSGIILSKEQLDLDNEKKKTGIYQYTVENIDSEKIKEIKDKTYAMLLDAEGEDIKLKMKKKLPKPGKSSEKKVDDKFCQIEADLKYWPQVKEAFMLPECKKAKIFHTFVIDQIILPEGEKDFVKIREKAKRKGKIIRKSEIDKQEKKEEKEFEA